MYTVNTRVGYSEVSHDGLISIKSIVNHMQNCSSFETHDLGASFDSLSEHGMFWVLNAWQVVFERRPAAYENISVSTWSHGCDNIFGFRNFVIKDKDDNLCAYANSIWAVADLETGRPVKVPQKVREAYVSHPKLDMEYADRKITMPKDMLEIESFFIKKDQIDTHMHVNNVKYIEMALQYLPDEFEIKQLRIQYHKSAVIGDIVTARIKEAENKFYVSLDSKDNKPYATLELS